ncbi:acetylglutamate kinase [Leuconostoc lactis]|uniref:acetylglutamate kinase n=1 Tax=Leuconostoc lactis TaxID=1246 RepID=UPI0011BBEDE2|nr:acetylglutamate kinase [Leuconostoc lactis]QEA50770.1 acetylglutamate kinase [Leuconostoc lactis]
MTQKYIIKIGGNAAQQLTPTFFETIKHWQKQHIQVAIVHGGGDQISHLMTQFNEPVQKFNGIRVTTAQGLHITQMALLGHVLDQALYGYVGVIHQVNTQLIQQLWQQNLIPIIAPLTMTNDGQWLNVNADHAATAIAKQLHADALYLLTDVAGVKVSGCLLQALTPKTAQQLTADHLATGGMIPKINSALSAVKRGVHHVHITNTVTQPGTVVTL